MSVPVASEVARERPTWLPPAEQWPSCMVHGKPMTPTGLRVLVGAMDLQSMVWRCQACHVEAARFWEG